jgi:hypothetical protein
MLVFGRSTVEHEDARSIAFKFDSCFFILENPGHVSSLGVFLLDHTVANLFSEFLTTFDKDLVVRLLRYVHVKFVSKRANSLLVISRTDAGEGAAFA